jgi:hypothetical protein
MTLEQLQEILVSAAWLTRVGQAPSRDEVTHRAAPGGQWQWLPSSRDEVDPVHSRAQREELEALGFDELRHSSEMSAAKVVLAGLRHVGKHPALQDGPHDLTEAVRGGAIFAARMATREALLGRPGVWTLCVELYSAGYWPCGITQSGTIVVY